VLPVQWLNTAPAILAAGLMQCGAVEFQPVKLASRPKLTEGYVLGTGAPLSLPFPSLCPPFDSFLDLPRRPSLSPYIPPR